MLASTFLHGWVSRIVIPHMLISNSGVQVTSKMWTELCRLLSLLHHLTTICPPQASDLVEHSKIKEEYYIRILCQLYSGIILILFLD